MKDPTLLRDAQRAGIHPHYLTAQRIAEVIASAYATPQAAIGELKHAYRQ